MRKKILKFLFVIGFFLIAIQATNAASDLYQSSIHIMKGYSLTGQGRNYKYGTYSIRFYHTKIQHGLRANEEEVEPRTLYNTRLLVSLRGYDSNMHEVTYMTHNNLLIYDGMDNTFPMGTHGPGSRFYFFSLAHDNQNWPGVDSDVDMMSSTS